MIKKFVLLSLFLVLLNCRQNEKINVQEIIDASIAISGGKLYLNSEIGFSSRNINYKYQRNGDGKLMSRFFTKDSKEIHDMIELKSFKRYVNGVLVAVPDSMAIRYSNSINSVQYFALLPHGLNDTAVNKEFLGKVQLKGKEYYKVKVTFDKKGGGDDFEDIFMYWFNEESFKPDYLAYQYFVNGGGFRFREAFNERYVNGIRFVDYKNYKPKESITSVEELDKVFENGGLKQVSEIKLENIEVSSQ